jgi:hypothetical protein
VCEAEKAELTATAAKTSNNHAYKLYAHRLCGWSEGDQQHATGGESDEDEDSDAVRHSVDEVWSNEFRDEGGHDISEEYDALGNRGAHEVLSGGEDDYVEDVIYEAYRRDLLANDGPDM